MTFQNILNETSKINISRGCSVLRIKRCGQNNWIIEVSQKSKLIDLAEKDILNIIQLTKENMAQIIKLAWGLDWDINFEKKY